MTLLTVKKARLLILILLVLCIFYGTYTQYERARALGSYDIITARVTGRGPTRQGVFIYLKYRYHDKEIENYISISKDTLKVGDEVIIRVSKISPSEYIELVGRK